MNRRFLYFSIILKFSNAITIHEALFFQTVKMSDISLLDDDAEVSIIKTLQFPLNRAAQIVFRFRRPWIRFNHALPRMYPR